jgi:hypothetical protein
VSLDAAAKVLNDILKHPCDAHGATSAYVSNKRKKLGTPSCNPSKAVAACLQNNGRVEQYIAALRTLLGPGEAQKTDIADIARHVTRAERELGEPFEELFARRASGREYATITRECRVLDEEVVQLGSAAAHEMYVAPLRRSA